MARAANQRKRSKRTPLWPAVAIVALSCQQLLGIEEGLPLEAGSSGSAGQGAGSATSIGGAAGAAGSEQAGGDAAVGGAGEGGSAGISTRPPEGGAAGDGGMAGAGGLLPWVDDPTEGQYLLVNAAGPCLVGQDNVGGPVLTGMCDNVLTPEEQIWNLNLNAWTGAWDLYDEAYLNAMAIEDDADGAPVVATFFTDHYWHIRRRSATYFELAPTTAPDLCLTALPEVVVTVCDPDDASQSWTFLQ